MEKLSARNAAKTAMTLGLGALLLGLLADVLGFGAEGFGPANLGLVVVGAALAGYGWFQYRQI